MAYKLTASEVDLQRTLVAFLRSRLRPPRVPVPATKATALAGAERRYAKPACKTMPEGRPGGKSTLR